MKKMRLHIYVMLALFLCTFILGSFLDLKVSEALFSEYNGFGMFVSVIGTIPGYGMLALLGGAAFLLGLKRCDKVWLRIIIFVVSVALFGFGLYFSGREFFGPNGYKNNFSSFVGLLLGCLIALPFMGGFFFLGYKLFSKTKMDFIPLAILIGILAVAIFMSLVPGVTLLKSIFHRPRYRMIQALNNPDVTFHNWWERCKNYKELMNTYGIIKEEFKSFPSGHAGAASVFCLVIPALGLLDKKYERLQLPLFYGGLVWVLLVAFSRILVGAHFLSDVSMGAIITCVFMLIANEVVINLKMFHIETPKEDSLAV